MRFRIIPRNKNYDDWCRRCVGEQMGSFLEKKVAQLYRPGLIRQSAVPQKLVSVAIGPAVELYGSHNCVDFWRAQFDSSSYE